MKVAIAKDGSEVAQHFGHCTEYAIFDIADGRITRKQIVPSPAHEPGKLPAFLASHQVTHVLAGGMGPKAVSLFCSHNIDVYMGISGPVDTVIQDFIAGRISPGQSSCTHGPDHECGH